jgi:hypothetical protein
MAERFVRLACALTLIPGLAFGQHGATPPDVPEHVRADAMVAPPVNEKVEDESAHRQAKNQGDRVRLMDGFHCSDPATRTPVAHALQAETVDWYPPSADPGYRPLAVIWRTPVADYPRALLDAGAPGAIGLLLFIDAEGKVARVEAVCATDPSLVSSAMRVARENRYRPSSMRGKPIRDLAYQIVAYGVAGD